MLKSSCLLSLLKMRQHVFRELGHHLPRRTRVVTEVQEKLVDAALFVCLEELDERFAPHGPALRKGPGR